MAIGGVRGTNETGSSPSPGSKGTASGAGSVNIPVLYKFDRDLIIPALPICKTEELETLLTFKL